MYGQFERENYDLKTTMRWNFQNQHYGKQPIFKTNASLYFKPLKYIEKQGWKCGYMHHPNLYHISACPKPQHSKTKDKVFRGDQDKIPPMQDFTERIRYPKLPNQGFWNQSHLSSAPRNFPNPWIVVPYHALTVLLHFVKIDLGGPLKLWGQK